MRRFPDGSSGIEDVEGRVSKSGDYLDVDSALLDARFIFATPSLTSTGMKREIKSGRCNADNVNAIAYLRYQSFTLPASPSSYRY